MAVDTSRRGASRRYEGYPSDLIRDSRDEEGLEALEQKCPVTGEIRTVVRWVELDGVDGQTRIVALEHRGEAGE